MRFKLQWHFGTSKKSKSILQSLKLGWEVTENSIQGLYTNLFSLSLSLVIVCCLFFYFLFTFRVFYIIHALLNFVNWMDSHWPLCWGLLDATNVIENPLLCVITSISYDHREYLGNTLEEIAFHKAGIMKNNCDVVSCPQVDAVLNVLAQQAFLKHCNLGTDFSSHKFVIENRFHSVSFGSIVFKSIRFYHNFENS